MLIAISIVAVAFGATSLALLIRNVRLGKFLSNMEMKHASMVDASAEMMEMLKVDGVNEFLALAKAFENKLRLKKRHQPFIDAGTDTQEQSDAQEGVEVRVLNACQALCRKFS